MEHPTEPLARMSTRDLRRLAAEAIRRHPDLRELIPDPDARFSEALTQAFPTAGFSSVVDLREALSRALDAHDDLQRLWALTDLIGALAAGFESSSAAAEDAAEVGAEIASLVHENAHLVADADLDLLDTRWVELIYSTWSRGWPWGEERSDAMAHGAEGDPELTDHIVRLAEADAARAGDGETSVRYATLALRVRIANGDMEEARHLVRRHGLGIPYCSMLMSLGRVPDILVQHPMLLEERREYATVAMGLALAGYAAEARSLAEAGRTWGTGEEEPIDEVLAQIPEFIPAPAPEPPPWAQGDETTWFTPGDIRQPAPPPPRSVVDEAYSAVQEGRLTDAVSLLVEEDIGRREPGFCAWVAFQAERAGVQSGDLAALFEAAAEGEIARANRRSYAKAVRHLEDVRRLLEQQGRGADWVRLLEHLRLEHARKSAFLEALEPLLSQAGLR